MEMYPIYDAKNRLSEICNQVSESGQPCVVTRRGRPIVRIMPIEAGETSDSVWSTVEESRARYGQLDEDFVMPKRDASQRPNPLA